MSPSDFRDRLEAVARRTGLTASDLAVWLGRPRPTVRTWLMGQRKPSPQVSGELWQGLSQKLIWLERSTAFPIPESDQSKFRRHDYIRAAYDHERLRSVRAELRPADADIGF